MTVATRMRAAGVIPLAPNQVTGLAAWYKADALGLADGAAVSSWADSSGNSRTLTQATGALQPTHETNELNGKPVVRFVVSKRLQSADLGAQAQPLTIIVVAKDAAAAADPLRVIFDGMGSGSATDRTTFYVGGGPTYVLQAGGAALGGTVNTSPHVFTARFDTTDTLRVDGVLTISGDAGGDPLRGINLGCWADGGNFSWAGDIAEVAVWFRALSTGERRSVERSLGAKWGITVAP